MIAYRSTAMALEIVGFHHSGASLGTFGAPFYEWPLLKLVIIVTVKPHENKLKLTPRITFAVFHYYPSSWACASWL